MSIDYFGVRTADPKLVGTLVESKTPIDGVPPIDVPAMHTLLTTKTSLRGKPGETLKFTCNDSHVFLYLSPTSVQMNHNTGGDFDDIMDVLMDAQDVVMRAGLNLWDPQQGEWFPGSPVLEGK